MALLPQTATNTVYLDIFMLNYKSTQLTREHPLVRSSCFPAHCTYLVLRNIAAVRCYFSANSCPGFLFWFIKFLCSLSSILCTDVLTHMCARVGLCTHHYHSMGFEIRGQILGVDSHFQPCGS